MTATITNHLGHAITGQIRCWMGRRIVEIETSDGGRHIGHLRDDEPRPTRASTVDSAAVRR